MKNIIENGTFERDHSACGIGLIVNIPQKNSHQLVLDALKVLSDFEYRSGYNIVTGENDGAGIRFYGLSVEFFNNKIQEGEFLSSIGKKLENTLLHSKHFAIGHYFLPTDPAALIEAKFLIEECIKQSDLSLVGWRDVNASCNNDVLSTKAQQKKPAIWQAIIMPKVGKQMTSEVLENTVLKAAIDIYSRARTEKKAINILSQSSESIVYKGMILPSQLGHFYRDLGDKLFTALAVQLHARFATNTDPQWANAQPCVFFWSHNGELNSAPANAKQMQSEMKARGFNGIFPNNGLSDSMQFDADLANQIVMNNISLIEALIRLMPPSPSNNYPAEINAMLKYFKLIRAPYDGPAFAVAGWNDNYIARLDSVGLRPSRWALIENNNGERQIIAASDDFVVAPIGGKIIQKSHLDPGGILMVTTDGKVLQTLDVLKKISMHYNSKSKDYFQQQLNLIFPLATIAKNSLVDAFDVSNISELNRILFSVGWDHEAENSLRYMAENGSEQIGAMGDDTNPLHVSLPAHLSCFFHQLFAQVSAPPIDSIRERERFWLMTTLGMTLDFAAKSKQIELKSPILDIADIYHLEHQKEVQYFILDTSFAVQSDDLSESDPSVLLRNAIKKLLQEAENAASQLQGGILILSDRNASSGRALIPDLIAVAAVQKYLENKNLSHKVSIVADSFQIIGPHQAAALLTVGAKAVYPRGGYAKITQLYQEQDINEKCKLYRSALEKCLLKTMGKMGILDVNNYINGHFMAALGINLALDENTLLDNPTLANIFEGFYSPLKGINLNHIIHGVLIRHAQAYNADDNFTLLPRSGFYMPEKGGLKHGYGPEVVNAFTDWMKAEELRATLFQINTILVRKGIKDFVSNPDIFALENGFLDPRQKDAKGFYPPEYLENFQVSSAFSKMLLTIKNYKKNNPTSLLDYFIVINKSNSADRSAINVQSQKEIRATLFSGSMSQGALTVANEQAPNKQGAHETLTRGMNAIGANSASGEGGESPQDLIIALTSTKSKQIASGRFGISALQIVSAEEMEIKMAQGAKPGEGGELHSIKITIRFAAQRGGLPGTSFISPPPHHDIYSIEDLEQLIYDIKSINPFVKVAVKLVASEGIGTISVGVTKAGADVINIASNSGGTGAAQQSSIKHAGMPAELGLVEVHKALQKVGLRHLVKLRVSGGLKTADDVIICSILGADLFEFGTTAMLTLGCKMQRTCNHSCQPGVTTDGHLFKGDQLHTERYFVNLTAAIQARLKELGISHLHLLRGRTDLLDLVDPKLAETYDFSTLFNPDNFSLTVKEDVLTKAREKLQSKLKRDKEDSLLQQIQNEFLINPSAIYVTDKITLTTQSRSFPARITGGVTRHFLANPTAQLNIQTTGNAGQSFGCFLSTGMSLKHHGTVQDGCGKSMTGGELIICTPDIREDYKAEENTIAGNAMFYGASGGKAFINGKAGHRFGILLKGAQSVVEGAGDFACEYMTSGTVMILGQHGKGLGTGASGGIVFVYDENNSSQPSNSVRIAATQENAAYHDAIKAMLTEHLMKTNSQKAKDVLNDFENKVNKFKIFIPIELDNIKTLQQIIDIIKTYHLRKSPLTVGMQVWLEQKTLLLLKKGIIDSAIRNELKQLLPPYQLAIFSDEVNEKIIQATKGDFGLKDIESLPSHLSDRTSGKDLVIENQLNKVIFSPKIKRSVDLRLGSLTGNLDTLLLDALEHINAYISELTQNAQGCSGCRAQSCAGGDDVDTGCPSGKAVNTINSILKRLGSINQGMLTKEQWRTLRQAFEVQIEESPFIAYTGAACPAPCQDACTETIPAEGSPNLKRGGKLTGEHVHIKDIEFHLYQIGRALGWFNGKKSWSEDQIASVFGGGSLTEGVKNKERNYDLVMKTFNPPFRACDKSKCLDQELIIVGSGPAAMQIAFQALRDGIKVRMYEKSSNPGGLLADGIPQHKFDKKYLTEDFAYLQEMGLQLYLNSEVIFDNQIGEYRLKNDPLGVTITDRNNQKQHLVLCTGAGQPKLLPPHVTSQLNEGAKKKIIQAIDFLKIANEIARKLNQSNLTEEEQNKLFEQYFGEMNPLHKKIVVIGGGDTSQDAIRWVARYFNYSHQTSAKNLNILVRAPEPSKRSIKDSYPSPSHAPTEENKLRDEEIKFVNGDTFHLVEPTKIIMGANNKLILHINKSKFKYIDLIKNDSQANALFESLPREMRPLGEKTEVTIDDVDMVICALGFEQQIIDHNYPRVYFAGDRAGVEQTIIIGAQTSGKNTYEQIRLAMGLLDNKPKPFKALLAPTLFAKSMVKTQHMKVSNSAPELYNEVAMKTSNSAPELCKSP